MLNKLLRYFYSKCISIYGENTEIYNIRLVVIKNFESCLNLAECFNRCKAELL